MKEHKRLDQILHIKSTIHDLESIGKNLRSLKFKKLKTLLVNGFRVMSQVSSVRYTAMIKSYVNNNTIDEDVKWN